MKLLSSLQNRIFLASALLAILSITFAIRFVTVRVTGEAEQELRRGLVEAGDLVEQQHTARLETLTVMARLIADLPKLKAVVDTGDPPTVQPLAQDYKARVRADVCVLTGRRGQVLVAIGAPGAEMEGSPAVRTALAGQESVTFRPAPGGLLEIVTVPVAIGPDPPEVAGTLSLGFALDDALAAQFKAVTESEVAFALDGELRAATLPGGRGPALSRVLESDAIASVFLDGAEYVALRRPLYAPAGPRAPMAVILRSRTERLRFVRTLHAALLVAALIAVLVAVLLSYAVARTVTGPLSAITATMREMAATGDLTRKIPGGRAWDDEDAHLLARTFNSLTDAIARFQREAALRERLSALGRLSTVIAHEVRNPLMIIKASLRTLRREGVPAPELREAAADIDHEVARLDRTVSDVLDFARPVRLEYAPTDLNALCREAAVSTLSGDSSPAVHFSLDPGLARVVTDGERLRTALANILSNAWESVRARGPQPAPAGDPPADIDLETVALSPGRAAIVVRDRGVGIDPADLPHVFEPYFTTKRTGTGLGLAIAKNIIDSLGGTLSARNRPPEGAEVRIELPTAEPTTPASPAPGAP
jgi:signal transduction histidine kinase